MTYALIQEVKFLLENLAEFEKNWLRETRESGVAMNWNGPIRPSMERLRGIINEMENDLEDYPLQLARVIKGNEGVIASRQSSAENAVEIRFPCNERGYKAMIIARNNLNHLVGDGLRAASPASLMKAPPGYSDEIDGPMKYKGWGNEPDDPTFPIRDKLRRAYDWDAWNAYDKSAATVENGMLARMEKSNDWAHIACGDSNTMKRATVSIIERIKRCVHPGSLTPSAMINYITNDPAWISMVDALRMYHKDMASIHSSAIAEALISAAIYASAEAREKDINVAVSCIMGDNEFAIAYNEFIEPAAPQQPEYYQALETWFLRDLNAEQRTKLIEMTMGKEYAKEATTISIERRCFAHIIREATKHEKR